MIENNETDSVTDEIPSLAEDIAAEFGHLFPPVARPLVDTSWALHVDRPLKTHFFGAKD